MDDDVIICRGWMCEYSECDQHPDENWDERCCGWVIGEPCP